MQAKKILKRSLLSLAFLTAFGFASFGTSSDAEARGCYRGGYGGYGGYGRVYHSYHRGGFYSPRVYNNYYRPHYYSPYRGGGFYYGGRGVSVGIGW